jgi:sec-independent protein translocase protein TatA
MRIFGLGPLELGLILLVVLILFGPKRLPQLGKSLGKTMKAIRDGVDGNEEDEVLEADAPSKQKAAATVEDDEA